LGLVLFLSVFFRKFVTIRGVTISGYAVSTRHCNYAYIWILTKFTRQVGFMSKIFFINRRAFEHFQLLTKTKLSLLGIPIKQFRFLNIAN